MILCFGEILMRVPVPTWWSTEGYQPQVVSFGGAEHNVAMALGLWGERVAFASAAPSTGPVQACLAQMAQRQIDCSRVHGRSGRLGLYFVGTDANTQLPCTWYDRSDSVFVKCLEDEWDWETELAGISHVHVSAIVPALSPALASATKRLLQVAQARRLTTSMDLNYRPALWETSGDPKQVIGSILPWVQVIFGNLWSIEKMLGIPVPSSLPPETAIDSWLDLGRTCLLEVHQQHPQLTLAALSFRFQQYYFTQAAARKGVFAQSTIYDVSAAPERIGSGDCFMAGLIFGLRNGFELPYLLECATRAARNKLFEVGDITFSNFPRLQT